MYLVGTVPPSEISAYLQAADVIVSPRCTGTNTPLKIYGYLRSGVPLVATDTLTHTQTLNSRVAELVPATSEGLARGMLRLLDDRDYAHRIAEAARRKADSQFSDKTYIDNVNDFYALLGV